MSQIVETILIGSGVPSTMAGALADSGSVGLVLAAWYLVVKLWVYPFASKFITDKLLFGKKLLESLDSIKEVLTATNNDISFKVAHLQSSQDRLAECVQQLLGDNVGNTDKRLALKTFAGQMHKQYLILQAFFYNRVRANHIKVNKDLIIGRYNRKGSELAGKSLDFLGDYHYKGHALSLFFGEGGAESHWRHLCNDLFSLQELQAQGELSVTPDDLAESFERILSKMMVAFKNWQEDPEKTYSLQKDELHLVLVEEPLDIEEL